MLQIALWLDATEECILAGTLSSLFIHQVSFVAFFANQESYVYNRILNLDNAEECGSPRASW